MLNSGITAAKQEAFEEATRLKHQFRTLDDGEVEFLDSVTQAERLKEASVKKANAEGLEAFRRQREEAERIEIEQSINEVRGEDWSTKKKRKRDRENEGGAKLKARRVSSIEGAEADTSVPPKSTVQKTSAVAANSPAIPSTTKSDDNSKSLATPPTTKEVVAKAATGLGLGAYSSDDD